MRIDKLTIAVGIGVSCLLLASAVSSAKAAPGFNCRTAWEPAVVVVCTDPGLPGA